MRFTLSLDVVALESSHVSHQRPHYVLVRCSEIAAHLDPTTLTAPLANTRDNAFSCSAARGADKSTLVFSGTMRGGDRQALERIILRLDVTHPPGRNLSCIFPPRLMSNESTTLSFKVLVTT